MWRPAENPSSRKWSTDALNIGRDKLGFLTVTLPVLACVGAHTVGGVEKVLRASFSEHGNKQDIYCPESGTPRTLEKPVPVLVD